MFTFSFAAQMLDQITVKNNTTVLKTLQNTYGLYISKIHNKEHNLSHRFCFCFYCLLKRVISNE